MYIADKDKFLSRKLDRIKMATRECYCPMFSDREIKFYLEEENGNVNNTIYRLLTLKAENGAIAFEGMTLPDSERYFMKVAMDYRPNNSGIL